MELIYFVLSYLLVGLLWKDWLEWYTRSTFEGKLGEPFTRREAVTQTLLWPIFVGIFILEFIRNLMGL